MLENQSTEGSNLRAAMGERERMTQDRVVQHFQKKLKYQYLGKWNDRPNNSNVEEE